VKLERAARVESSVVRGESGFEHGVKHFDLLKLRVITVIKRQSMGFMIRIRGYGGDRPPSRCAASAGQVLQ